MSRVRSTSTKIGGSLLIAIAVLSACTTSVPLTSTPPIQVAEPLASPAESTYIPVVRYGRYTLVELAPSAAQRDLLAQIVDVSLPASARASVGDGIQHVLKRSGYRLCQPTSSAAALYALPLPAAHYRLGPLTLRDALLSLAGPAWEMQVDDRARTVCFLPITPDAAHPEVVSTHPTTTGGAT